MEICILSHPLKSFGGAERVVLAEARHFHEQGHDVTLLPLEYDQETLLEFGLPQEIEVVECPTPIEKFRNRVRFFRKEIAERGPDVVYSHYQEEVGYCALATLRHDPEFVTHVHGSAFWFENNPRLIPHMSSNEVRAIIDSIPGHSEFQSDFSAPIICRAKSRIKEYLYSRALNRASIVFTGTEQVRRELSALYGVNATVVRPGVPKEWIDSYEDVSTRELSDSDFTILSLGRLDRRKRIRLLIKAIDLIRKDGEDISLVIGGAGSNETYLKKTVNRRSLNNAVEFVGHIPDEQIAEYYKSADLFACPAWMSYGLTPLEAYSMRTRVAISTDTFVKEILADAPGVSVITPDEVRWCQRMKDDLLSANPEFNTDIVPTWESYCKIKMNHIENIVDQN